MLMIALAYGEILIIFLPVEMRQILMKFTIILCLQYLELRRNIFLQRNSGLLVSKQGNVVFVPSLSDIFQEVQ